MAHFAEELRFCTDHPGYGFHNLHAWRGNWPGDLLVSSICLFQKQSTCAYFLLPYRLFYNPCQLCLGKKAHPEGALPQWSKCLVLIHWAVLLFASPVPPPSVDLLWVSWLPFVRFGSPSSLHCLSVHRFFSTYWLVSNIFAWFIFFVFALILSCHLPLTLIPTDSFKLCFWFLIPMSTAS